MNRTAVLSKSGIFVSLFGELGMSVGGSAGKIGGCFWKCCTEKDLWDGDEGRKEGKRMRVSNVR